MLMLSAINSGGIPKPPSYVYDVNASCFNTGKLQDNINTTNKKC